MVSGSGCLGRTVRAAKSAARAVWASGDYHRFATHLICDLGELLVDATGIGAGRDVLDVACGTGNTALRAAARGACVVGCDLTPENFPAGVRAAADLGVEIQWLEGDAEALPFDQASFDVVVSSVGAMWAPNHQAVADELVRVCRPGGIIGMINFAAGGLSRSFSPCSTGSARHLHEGVVAQPLGRRTPRPPVVR